MFSCPNAKTQKCMHLSLNLRLRFVFKSVLGVASGRNFNLFGLNRQWHSLFCAYFQA